MKIVGLLGLLVVAGCGGGKHQAAATTSTTSTGPTGRVVVAISVPPPAPLTTWSVTTDNLYVMPIRVTAGGAPVAGLRLSVDGFELPPTDSDGRATYSADSTRLARHVVDVADVSQVKIGGSAPATATTTALSAGQAALTVAYPIHDLTLGKDSAGNPTVSGRITYADGAPPPAVSRYTYQLTGTVTDSYGKPVADARVSTRTVDRDYWTVSSPTDAAGRYSSLFTASDEGGGNPVPFTVRVSKGDLVYQFLSEEFVYVPATQERADEHPAAATRLPDRAAAAPTRIPAPSTRESSSASRLAASRSARSGDVARRGRALHDDAAEARSPASPSRSGRPSSTSSRSRPPLPAARSSSAAGRPSLPCDAPQNLVRVRLK